MKQKRQEKKKGTKSDMQTLHLIEWLKDVDKEDINLVGGKGANLGEIMHKSFPVPNGFVVTSNTYFNFIKENNLAIKIKQLLGLVDFNNPNIIEKISKQIKHEILSSKMSDELAKKINSCYQQLGRMFKDIFVAVRSSSNFEDLKNASFAGQQDSFLNVKGDANLILKIKEVWASLFNARAIFYRHENKIDNSRLGIAVVVQKMLEAEKSGVMFTIDPVTNDKTKIIIEAIYGLGELIVRGDIIPDNYIVSKNDISIIHKNIANQKIFLKRVGNKNKKINLSEEKGNKQKLHDDEIIELAKLGKELEKNYYFPQDIEWAIEKNKLYVVQTRPVTTVNQKSKVKSQNVENLNKQAEKTILVKGNPASPGIASGPAKVISSVKEISKIARGDVLVAKETNPDFVPAMKKAVAIVTDKGGRTSHAAIVSRELGIPAIVGAQNATKVIETGNVITVNGTNGEIYEGSLALHNNVSLPSNLPFIKTATKVYVNLSDPDLAEKTSLQDVDGVGLLRAEFIMAQIGTHPKKLIRDGKEKLFINKLSDSLLTFCEAFGPRPVIYRTSDLKTNEYRNLLGGRDFEPKEENPMLGYRGAFRYISDPKVFNLELEAIKLARHIKGCKNLWIMVPFVRTVRELINVKKLISSSGLYRSENFKIWMMVEIPSNVVLLEKFIETGIDGVSIGSNDLTQLMLGIDRDSNEVAAEFDEQNESVLWALEKIIKTCHKYKITSSICGQAASTYPDLLEKLVKWGISSVSVSPDAVYATRVMISQSEKKIWQR